MRVARVSFSSLLVSVAILGGSATAGQAPKGRAPAPAQTRPAPAVIYGFIDSARRLTTSPTLDVTGWAADDRAGAPVAKVEILLNGSVAGVAHLGEVRRDVAQTYRRKDLLNSGWKAFIDLKGRAAGVYRVTARAWNGRGQSALLNTPFPMEIRIP